MDKIYLVIGGEYSDWFIHSYFTDKEKAEKYCVVKNRSQNSYEELRVEEVSLNSSKMNYDKLTLKKHFHITFDKRDGNWKLGNEPERYENYIGKCKPTTSERYKYNMSIWVVETTADTYRQALKIAYDKIAEVKGEYNDKTNI